MENFNESKEQNRKQNKTFSILLVLILTSIILILSFLIIDFLSGPTIKKDQDTYTVKNVSKSFEESYKYWNIEVGTDIPSGYYNIKGSSLNKKDYNYLSIMVDYPEDFFLENIDINKNELSDNFKFYEDYDTSIDFDENNIYHYIDNIFLPEGTTVKLMSYKPQDAIFQLLKDPNILDSKDGSKDGFYKTTNKKIEIPVFLDYNNLSISNKYEIFTYSNDKQIFYYCMDDSCDYEEYNVKTKETKTKKIILEDEFGKESKYITIDLLDKSFIKIYM